jgi:hypothetical protein
MQSHYRELTSKSQPKIFISFRFNVLELELELELELSVYYSPRDLQYKGVKIYKSPVKFA